MWNQKKVVKINDCKTIADLFMIGCNWDERRRKLLIVNRIKAQRLADELQRRLEKIYQFMDETGLITNVIREPKWFHNIRMRPVTEALIEARRENDFSGIN